MVGLLPRSLLPSGHSIDMCPAWRHLKQTPAFLNTARSSSPVSFGKGPWEVRVVKNPRRSGQGVEDVGPVPRDASGRDDGVAAGGPGAELAGRVWERVFSLASC